MAFKADIDDIRDSLSYKLGKVLRFHGAEVSYSDEFAQDPTFITKEQLVDAATSSSSACPTARTGRWSFRMHVDGRRPVGRAPGESAR